MSKPRVTSKFIWGLCIFLLTWAVIGGMILSRAAKEYTAKAYARGEISLITRALEQYREKTGVLLDGDNGPLFRTLAGSNASQTVFFASPHTNALGAALDFWGTPYQIEKPGATNVLVRSAGKNKTFGDEDDVVLDETLK